MLEAVNISKKYYMQSSETSFVVKNFNLNVDSGETIAITGVSGSGKTTILNILGGLIPPTEGKVLFKGDDINTYNEKKAAQYRNRNVAYILQNYGLIEEESVKYNILLPLKFREKGLIKTNNSYQYRNILESLNLEDKANERVSRLSGGQKQRVAIARAIIQDADILLADEPTGALDSSQSIEIINLLVNFVKEKNKALVLVTHDLSLASKCDECISLKKI